MVKLIKLDHYPPAAGVSQPFGFANTYGKHDSRVALARQAGCTIEPTVNFKLYPVRFTFQARESIHFPPGKSGNILRGAFGTIFRRIACMPECKDTRTCPIRATCPYARLFEPSAEAGPSGLADRPRPFVFRAAHLDGKTVAAGLVFYFDLNLFDTRNPAIGHFILAFSHLAREGLGPRRGRAELVSVHLLDEAGCASSLLYEGPGPVPAEIPPPLILSLEPGQAATRIRVRFVTPTELKGGPQSGRTPEFAVLLARIRDRLSTLRTLYGEGPLEIDFRGLGERAATVRLVASETHFVDVTRRSSRTGQVHPLGGLVGFAEYEGDLGEFLPYLNAARWTGVGRQTVWGKGQLAVEVVRGGETPVSISCYSVP